LTSTSEPAAELPPARERLAILALSMGAFVMMLNANVLAALGPFLMQDPGLTKPQYLDLLGIAGGAGAFGALLLGPIVDRVGRRPPMLWGLVLFVIGSAGHCFANDFATLYTFRAVTGFAGGVVFTGASTAVADLVPYERRGRAMGVFSAGMFLGFPAGLPLAQFMAGWGWWQGIFAVQTLLSLVALFFLWRVLPHALGGSVGFWRNVPRLFRMEILAALLSVMFYVGAYYTTVNLVGLWLDDAKILPRAGQWPVWLVLGVLTAVGAVWLTRGSDRFGKRRFVMLTTVIVAVCVAGLALVTDIWGVVIVGIPIALVSGARTGPFQAVVSEMVSTETRGTLMGVRAFFVNAGTFSFPWLCARLQSGWNVHFAGILLVAAGGIFLSYLLVQLWVKQK
jgi:predicted MFS family arabinose efflux permease